MGRLIIISNRLPFSLDKEGDKLSIRQSSGGLVSAIKSYFESNVNKDQLSEKLWMGVADFPQEDWDQAVASHAAKQKRQSSAATTSIRPLSPAPTGRRKPSWKAATL